MGQVYSFNDRRQARTDREGLVAMFTDVMADGIVKKDPTAMLDFKAMQCGLSRSDVELATASTLKAAAILAFLEHENAAERNTGRRLARAMAGGPAAP